MPGKVIGTALNHGYPGTVSRNGDEISRSHPVKSDSADIPFGYGAMLNTDGTVSAADATLTDDNFVGVAMRKVKSALTYLTQENGVYKKSEVGDFLQRGSVTVQCMNGTPTVGGDVYIRIADNPAIPDVVIGGFEAVADGANSVKLTNVKWSTLKDANGVAEITLLTRKNV